MRGSLETVESSLETIDPLVSKQKEDVARMRASLLACSTNLRSTREALQNITVLRLFHQMSRLIRYIEVMDKIEDKLYRSIDARLERMDDADPFTLAQLLKVQESLQKNMIESSKLLEPYLNISETVSEMMEEINSLDANTYDDSLIPKSDRDKLRLLAREVLNELNSDEIEV